MKRHGDGDTGTVTQGRVCVGCSFISVPFLLMVVM